MLKNTGRVRDWAVYVVLNRPGMLLQLTLSAN